MQFITDTYSSIQSCYQHWRKEEAYQNPEGFITTVFDRAIIHGLPVSIMSTAAVAYLFQCCTLPTAAAFATVHYLALTVFVEIARNHHEVGTGGAIALIGLSSAISLGVAKTVCKASLTYQSVTLLTIAALAGFFFRNLFIAEDS